MANILITLAEERESTRADHFAVKYKVDEYDCYDFTDALKETGHDVYFVNWDDLRGVEFTRMFHDNAKAFVSPLPISRMDLTFIYKMEGFYFDLSRFLCLVELFETVSPLVVNNPATIRHNLDKRYLWALEKKGVRVIRTRLVDAPVRERLAAGETFVFKPIRGERGNGIHLVKRPEDLAVVEGLEDKYLAQDFMPNIRRGERSLVFLGFEYQLAVIKRPAADNPEEFRCNESLGGTVEVYEPTPAEVEFAVAVLRAYESLGCPVHYSRIDLIETDDGPTLMEAELINPAAYANYSRKGRQFGQSLARYFGRLLAAR